MTLVISKANGGIRLRNGWQPIDADAAAYITAVETADGQALEQTTKIAIDNFVLGCKADGIWNAIKASCILAGARTLSGALVPLVGTAPTNFNFVSGDYNRKTGLVGNGSTKYLNSNRNANADPQDNAHISVHISTSPTGQDYPGLIGAGGATGVSGSMHINPAFPSNIGMYARCRNSVGDSVAGTQTATGFVGISRNSSASYSLRVAANTTFFSRNSQSPVNANHAIFATDVVNTASNARLAFYSIGESLNLALLNTRVTDLINAIGAAF